MPQALLHKLCPELRKTEYNENPEQPRRIIVEMNQSVTGRVTDFVNHSQGKVHRKVNVFPGLVVELPFSHIQEMTWFPYIKKIWHDTQVQALMDIAAPTVGGYTAQESGFTGKDMVAAVIDTGIYPHTDLIYPENRIIGWYDLVNERDNPYDDNGHGTHIAGIIAGNGAISRGRFRGMAPEAKLVGVKALDRNGSGNTSDVIAAIEWCIKNREQYKINAINLSLGSIAQDSCRNDPLCRAATAAWKNGIVVCVAAGNDGPEAGTINTPGINSFVITVGNLDDNATIEWDDDQLNPSSSRGPTIDNINKPDLLAPGTTINSLRVPRGYRAFSGTSMATGVVTGAVLQILQKNPDLAPDEVKRLLVNHTRFLDLDTNQQGAGVINLNGIFEEAKQNRLENNIFTRALPLTMFALAPFAFSILL
ncbi:MAG: S8 family peptidase [Bacteroidota bacterium]